MQSKYVWIFAGFLLLGGFLMTMFGAPRANAQSTNYPYTSGSPNGNQTQNTTNNNTNNQTPQTTPASSQNAPSTFLYITPPVLPAAEVNVPYYQTINAQTNAEGPFMWSLLAGRVPFGLTLRTSTSGTAIDIMGTPVTAGISNFTIGVTNQKFSAVQTYFMVVNVGNGASMQATAQATTTPTLSVTVTPLAPNTGIQATTEPSIEELQGTLADLKAKLAALQAMAPQTATLATPKALNTGTSGIFYRDIKVGDRGEDVHALQVFLNNNGFVITNEGVGAPGAETNFFGMMTQQALVRFQTANGIAPARGYLGPLTRARIEAMMGTQ